MKSTRGSGKKNFRSRSLGAAARARADPRRLCPRPKQCRKCATERHPILPPQGPVLPSSSSSVQDLVHNSELHCLPISQLAEQLRIVARISTFVERLWCRFGRASWASRDNTRPLPTSPGSCPLKLSRAHWFDQTSFVVYLRSIHSH